MKALTTYYWFPLTVKLSAYSKIQFVLINKIGILGFYTLSKLKNIDLSSSNIIDANRSLKATGNIGNKILLWCGLTKYLGVIAGFSLCFDSFGLYLECRIAFKKKTFHCATPDR